MYGVDLTVGVISLFAGLGLILINFFVKSPLLYLAIIPCMVGCIFEPLFQDYWFQSGCALVAIWAVIAFFKRMNENIGG